MGRLLAGRFSVWPATNPSPACSRPSPKERVLLAVFLDVYPAMIRNSSCSLQATVAARRDGVPPTFVDMVDEGGHTGPPLHPFTTVELPVCIRYLSSRGLKSRGEQAAEANRSAIRRYSALFMGRAVSRTLQRLARSQPLPGLQPALPEGEGFAGCIFRRISCDDTE